MICASCKKTLTSDMETEFSKTCDKAFCSADCGINYITNFCRLLPMPLSEIKRNKELPQ